MSPGALQRKYLPRSDGHKPHPAHQPAARAAVPTQAKPLNATIRNEGKTKNATASHRPFRVEPFKPGFEMETEIELAIAFHRPVRH